MGGGTLTLSGTNTYTGGTNVFNGELIVTAPQAIKDGTNLYVGAASSYFAPTASAPSIGGAATATAVPEPRTLVLLAAGAVSAFVALRRRKQMAAR